MLIPRWAQYALRAFFLDFGMLTKKSASGSASMRSASRERVGLGAGAGGAAIV
jgi:hypothetical protein